MEACANAGWRALAPAEQLPVAEALGRVTAAPVSARWPSPRFRCAAMDGIAILASAHEVREGTRVAGEPVRAASGSFAWVDTGDPMPAGLDTVVRRERVTLAADGSAQFTGPAPRGLHVRAAGEDFQAGQPLMPAGHRLRPADLAAAAAAGHVTLDVARTPVAAIIPTGNEIRPIGAPLRSGEITDSNSLMLAARATETGASPVVADVQPDDPAVLAAAVRRAAATADLVLVIAGSSAGRSDHTAAVLAQAGGLAVRGVAVRPGHPVLLGHAGRREVQGQGRAQDSPIVPVIGVPGYPLAAAVIFELFAVPLIAAMLGGRPPDPGWRRAQLACDWVSAPETEEWVTVSLTAAPGGPADSRAVLATPSGRGAGAIGRLVRADAWWPIPVGQAKFARGAFIDVRPVPGAPR